MLQNMLHVSVARFTVALMMGWWSSRYSHTLTAAMVTSKINIVSLARDVVIPLRKGKHGQYAT